MTAPRRLVLWDIDRTLLNVSPLIVEAMTAAAADALATPQPKLAPITGRPESASMLDTLLDNGLPEKAARERLPEALRVFTAEMQRRAPRFASEGMVLPGVRAALAALAKDDTVVQSVVTGSLRGNAIVKLLRFGLHLELSLDVGAFGDEAFTRPELVRIARERAHRKYGVDFAGSGTVLIGDSGHDVDAGLRSDARVIGVATGLVSAEQLREAGTHLVMADLNNTAELLGHIADDPILAGS